MMFSAVPKQVLDVVWEDVKKLLEPAVETAKGKMTIKDVYQYIKNDFYNLWVVMEDTKIVACVTTRVIQYPESRALALDFIGGRKMKEWLPEAQGIITRFARDNGCRHLEGYGRKAWIRWGRQHGWKQDYIAYKMEL
jgi:hypothetical protein